MPVHLLPRPAQAAALAACVALFSAPAYADFLNDTGVILLRAVNPTLTGTGIAVAQPESSDYVNNVDTNDFEVTTAGTGLSPNVTITYINSSGNTATTYPNTVGTVSGHASGVAAILAGSSGVAPNVTSIFNYDADFFVNNIIISSTNGTLDPSVHIINQSFIEGDDPSVYNIVNQVYDDFVDLHPNVLIISGAGNGPTNGMPLVQSPATAYNSISVGALEFNPGSSGTPAGDGRTKVDIIATGNAFGFGPGTSYAAPIVSGIAVLLEQAGSLGLAGAGTQTAATDARTLKSILLTGATKPDDWSHTATDPLDDEYGAGIVNAYASYRILTGGQYRPSSSSTVSLTGAHPAVTTGTPVGNLGWALQNNTLSSGNAAFGIRSSATTDGINHYALTLPATGFAYILTATLTWNRPYDSYNNINNSVFSGINNLDLFLYNGSNQITESISTLDSVQQIYVPDLAPGTYDMQVLKQGGTIGSPGVVSNAEGYALSWSAELVGDVNWDGVVDISDLTTIANNWQTNQTSIFNGDLNGDGVVNQADFAIAAANWQSGSSGSDSVTLPSLQSIMVPEPTSIALLLTVAIPFLSRRKRRAPA